MPFPKQVLAPVLYASHLKPIGGHVSLVYWNPKVKTTTAEPHVMQVVIVDEVLVQPLDLLLHEGELDLNASLFEVLAVEVQHEVPDDRCVVVHPVMLGRGCAPISVRCEVCVGYPVPTFPVLLQLTLVMHDSPVATSGLVSYYEDLSRVVECYEGHSNT